MMNDARVVVGAYNAGATQAGSFQSKQKAPKFRAKLLHDFKVMSANSADVVFVQELHSAIRIDLPQGWARHQAHAGLWPERALRQQRKRRNP